MRTQVMSVMLQQLLLILSSSRKKLLVTLGLRKKKRESFAQIAWVGGTGLLCLVTSNRAQGNTVKLHQGKLRLEIRKRLFTESTVSHKNRLARKVVTAPRPSEFKECLHNALSYEIYFQVVLQETEFVLMILMSPFQLEIFYDSVIPHCFTKP